MKIDELTLPGRVYIYGFRHSFSIYNIAKGPLSIPLPGANGANGVPKWGRKLRINASCLQDTQGGSTAGVLAIVHFGSVGRLCGLFERSKAT